MRRTLIVFVLGITCACGDGSDLLFNPFVATQLAPIVSRVAPANATAGTTVTVFGYGFTSLHTENIVFLGGTSTSAASYAAVSPPLSTELEQITFVVPTGASVGATTISVAVYENVSNANITFTVDP